MVPGLPNDDVESERGGGKEGRGGKKGRRVWKKKENIVVREGDDESGRKKGDPSQSAVHPKHKLEEPPPWEETLEIKKRGRERRRDEKLRLLFLSLNLMPIALL